MKRFSGKYQNGLTLLEVMVALAIGAFMLAGILSLVASVSRARTDLDITSEQIENGRFALQLFGDEISLAGFYGQHRIGNPNYSFPDPCDDATTITDLGFDGSTSPITIPINLYGYAAGDTLPTCLPNIVADSEVLVVHRVENTSIAAGSAVAGRPYLQASACDTDTPSTFIFSKTPSDFTLNQNDCATAAPVWPYTVKTLYLASCDDCSGSGDGIPTLKMRELVSGVLQTTPLVEGVSDMHLEYGLDLDGDGNPDCYAVDPDAGSAPAACTGTWGSAAENWANVVSVKVHLLVRTTNNISGWTDDHKYDLGRGDGNESGPFNDGFRRQVYTTTVVLPNVAGARE